MTPNDLYLDGLRRALMDDILRDLDDAQTAEDVLWIIEARLEADLDAAEGRE